MKPGRYIGRDGKSYLLLGDGTAYERTFHIVNGERRPGGLRRVGTARAIEQIALAQHQAAAARVGPRVDSIRRAVRGAIVRGS